MCNYDLLVAVPLTNPWSSIMWMVVRPQMGNPMKILRPGEHRPHHRSSPLHCQQQMELNQCVNSGRFARQGHCLPLWCKAPCTANTTPTSCSVLKLVHLIQIFSLWALEKYSKISGRRVQPLDIIVGESKVSPKWLRQGCTVLPLILKKESV